MNDTKSKVTTLPNYQLERLAESIIKKVIAFWENPPPKAVARLAELDRLDKENNAKQHGAEELARKYTEHSEFTRQTPAKERKGQNDSDKL